MSLHAPVLTHAAVGKLLVGRASGTDSAWLDGTRKRRRTLGPVTYGIAAVWVDNEGAVCHAGILRQDAIAK